MTANNQVAEASVKYLAEAAGQTLPAGYKQTEIGLIPVDWEVYRLGDRASFIGSGKTNTKSSGEYPLYGSTGLIGSCKNPEYEGEAILVARVGANAGKLNFVSGEYGVSDNTILVKLKPENLIQYYRYWLIRKNLNNLVFGSGQPLITGTQIKELLLPFPPEKEQADIANALSDADALINELEKLIAKKQAIKTATMQQLLTGRTRLPQFALREDGTNKGYKQSEFGEIPEDWDVFQIGDISEVIRGASPRPKGDKRYYGGKVPRLMVEDVTRDGKYVTPCVDFLTEAGAKLSRPCAKGTLTLVCSGTVGVPSILAVDACIHDGFLALVKISQKIYTDYLFHYFSTQQEKFNNSATHGGVFTNLTTDGVRQFLVPVPVEKEEQTAIASILSDMDTDIQTLQQRLSKTRQIKQGMMQELLTGRIRLLRGA
jgi:type I restriction enzyme S subunit